MLCQPILTTSQYLTRVVVVAIHGGVVVPVIGRSSLVVARRVGAVAGVVADLIVVPHGVPRRRLGASLVLQVGGVVGFWRAVVVGIVDDGGRLFLLVHR